MMLKPITLFVETKYIFILKLENDNNISGLSFEGEGCAISLASASILTETLKGKDLNFSKKVTDDFKYVEK